MNRFIKVLLIFGGLLVLGCGGRSELKVSGTQQGIQNPGPQPLDDGPLPNVFLNVAIETFRNDSFGYSNPFSDISARPILKWEIEAAYVQRVQQIALFTVDDNTGALQQENLVRYFSPDESFVDFASLGTGVEQRYALAAVDTDGRVGEPVFFVVDTRQRISSIGWDADNDRQFAYIYDVGLDTTSFPFDSLRNAEAYFFEVLPDGKTGLATPRGEDADDFEVNLEASWVVSLDEAYAPYSMGSSLVENSIEFPLPNEEDPRLNPRWSPTGEYRVLKTDIMERTRFYLIRKQGFSMEIRGPFFVGDDIIGWQWSPDGRSLVLIQNAGQESELLFVDPEQLFLRGEDSLLFRTGNLVGERVYGQWSPDSRWFVYSTSTNESWFLADVQRKSFQSIGSENSLAYGRGPFAWSADSRHVGFYEEDMEPQQDVLTIFSVETSEILAHLPQEQIREFGFVPGQALVLFYELNGQGTSLSTQGWTEDPPVFAFETPFSELDFMTNVFWSADGSKVLFEGAVSPMDSSEVFVMDKDDPERLINLSETVREGGILSKHGWSPDNEWVTFNIFKDDGVSDLYVTRSDGSINPKRISEIQINGQSRRFDVSNASWLPYSLEFYEPN